ncbi:MAG: type II toxin-antitoxin system HicA family toxin [Acidobacteria bacterium]|nr:type II toxin-antitoxin system HicA family toxin [Acidobacteriota bacterium]
MKRREFLRYLAEQGCDLLREGSRHYVYHNPKALRTSTVPRHREVDDFVVRKICRDLQILPPK